MKQLIFKLILYFKKLQQLNYRPLHNKFIHKQTPFYSQKQTGTKNKLEDKLWRENGCGLACLKMILGAKKRSAPSLVSLGRLAQKYGCYIENPKAKHGMDGLFYKPFLIFIEKEFNLRGKILSPMTIQDIIEALDNKKYVLASVSPEVRNLRGRPKQPGGHLVLITGYEWDKKILIFNNPSYIKTQENQEIRFKNFSCFFAKRGLVIN